MMLSFDYFMPNKNFRGFTVATIDHANFSLAFFMFTCKGFVRHNKFQWSKLLQIVVLYLKCGEFSLILQMLGWKGRFKVI